mgnify:CR=1 FL=1
MSKKDDTLSVKWLIEEGILPVSIANYLVLLDNKAPSEIFTLEEAIEWVDLKKISKEAATFDLDKLRFINRKHLENIEEMRLSKLLGFADNDIGTLAKIYIEEASTIKELKNKLEAIFAPKTSCEGFEEEFKILMKCMRSAPFYADFDELKKYIISETKLSQESLENTLRYILTGSLNGPTLGKIYPLIKNYLGEIIK